MGMKFGNPEAKIAAALDASPSPGGAPGGAGAPPPPGATGAPGPPQQQPLPQAQVYQPDPANQPGIATLMMQAHQKNRDANAIDRNTASIVAGFSPLQDRASIRGSFQPQDDTVGVADQIVNLQKEKFQNDQARQFSAGVSLMLQQKYGMTKEQADGIAANPQVAGQFVEPTGNQKDVEAYGVVYAKSKGYGRLDPSKWTDAQRQDVESVKANALAGQMGGTDLEQRQYQAELAAGRTIRRLRDLESQARRRRNGN